MYVCWWYKCVIRQSLITRTMCELISFYMCLCVSGIRTEQDLYVRLIDSMTKQVRQYWRSQITTLHSSVQILQNMWWIISQWQNNVAQQDWDLSKFHNFIYYRWLIFQSHSRLKFRCFWIVGRVGHHANAPVGNKLGKQEVSAKLGGCRLIFSL